MSRKIDFKLFFFIKLLLNYYWIIFTMVITIRYNFQSEVIECDSFEDIRDYDKVVYINC